ncbi:MAG: prephenate dehydrogenase [Bacteroides sp.]|nr:prephenate dehydrogenase [Eubacterium sp.]MCM1417736.1 prephenate dehydrogenase [Roseburia sp.]MCM1461373.1 prephenate dehydrogenase [Bacteroides sp.]
MNIAIVGLGLIGGSFCRTLKKHTFHRIMGIDRDPETIRKALESGAIDEEIEVDRLSEANLTILCLYPEAIVDFVRENADRFKKGGIVTDSCGVKEYVVSRCTPILAEKGVIFVGTHPMAGREFSGFDYSTDDLFEGASYIITPTDETPQIAVDLLQTLAGSLGFGKAVVSTPKRHDEIIAYTSQLAHVVSNAYVKSPTMLNFDGFSAGSFQDLTRVAKLNEYMWSELFMCNREALLNEIDCILEKIAEYRDAIRDGRLDRLIEILRDGRELKEASLRLYDEHASGKGNPHG